MLSQSELFTRAVEKRKEMERELREARYMFDIALESRETNPRDAVIAYDLAHRCVNRAKAAEPEIASLHRQIHPRALHKTAS
jgi:hypothetical protein